MWLRFFRYSVCLAAIVGGATFYFPLTGLGVLEAYEMRGLLFRPKCG